MHAVRWYSLYYSGRDRAHYMYSYFKVYRSVHSFTSNISSIFQPNIHEYVFNISCAFGRNIEKYSIHVQMLVSEGTPLPRELIGYVQWRETLNTVMPITGREFSDCPNNSKFFNEASLPNSQLLLTILGQIFNTFTINLYLCGSGR